MMRIVEILTSIPSLLLTLLIMMVLGQNMGALLVAMCLTSWCGTARQMRGMIMQLRESEYVMAAETLGANPSWIIRKHLIPNTLEYFNSECCHKHSKLHFYGSIFELSRHGIKRTCHQSWCADFKWTVGSGSVSISDLLSGTCSVYHRACIQLTRRRSERCSGSEITSVGGKQWIKY